MQSSEAGQDAFGASLSKPLQCLPLPRLPTHLAYAGPPIQQQVRPRGAPGPEAGGAAGAGAGVGGTGGLIRRGTVTTPAASVTATDAASAVIYLETAAAVGMSSRVRECPAALPHLRANPRQEVVKPGGGRGGDVGGGRGLGSGGYLRYEDEGVETRSPCMCDGNLNMSVFV